MRRRTWEGGEGPLRKLGLNQTKVISQHTCTWAPEPRVRVWYKRKVGALGGIYHSKGVKIQCNCRLGFWWNCNGCATPAIFEIRWINTFGGNLERNSCWWVRPKYLQYICRTHRNKKAFGSQVITPALQFIIRRAKLLKSKMEQEHVIVQFFASKLFLPFSVIFILNHVL